MNTLMKSLFGILALSLLLAFTAFAQEEEPLLYVVKKGDTLWGLSERFVRDPYYWPRMWEVNQGKVTNPHFIYPGQRVRIYHDRIEIEPRTSAAPETFRPLSAMPSPAAAVQSKVPLEEVAPERTFVVSGAEGMLVPRDMQFAGSIVAIAQNRTIAGEDDVVYLDTGRENGVKVGDRYRVFKKGEEIRHPVSNQLVGVKILPLGSLQVSELESKSSKAIIHKSFKEIEPGSVLLPYLDNRRDLSLKAATREFSGLIVATQTGNRAIASGEVCYLDLGAADGLQVGNMLYVVRDVEIDSQFIKSTVGKLPVDVIGALVIVDLGERSSTALVVKSIDTVYQGDRVEFRPGN